MTPEDQAVAGAVGGLAIYIVLSGIKAIVRKRRAVWRYKTMCNTCGTEWGKYGRYNDWLSICKVCGTTYNKHDRPRPFTTTPWRINPETGKAETK